MGTQLLNVACSVIKSMDFNRQSSAQAPLHVNAFTIHLNNKRKPNGWVVCEACQHDLGSQPYHMISKEAEGPVWCGWDPNRISKEAEGRIWCGWDPNSVVRLHVSLKHFGFLFMPWFYNTIHL